MFMLSILVGVKPEPGNPQHYNKEKLNEDLFRRIGEGDGSAFEELYRTTEKTLYAFILSLTKDHQNAMDILQDTYLKIRSAAHLYRPMGKPLAWMFTIARNLFHSGFRQTARFADTEDMDIENDLNFSYVSDSVDKLVLQSALMLLNEEEREIILLYAVSGLKHREIAENLDLGLSTVLSKYHRGLKKLRKYLEEKEVSR